MTGVLEDWIYRGLRCKRQRHLTYSSTLTVRDCPVTSSRRLCGVSDAIVVGCCFVLVCVLLGLCVEHFCFVCVCVCTFFVVGERFFVNFVRED